MTCLVFVHSEFCPNRIFVFGIDREAESVLLNARFGF